MTTLNDDQIRTLWSHFDIPEWSSWHKGYLDFITWANGLTETELGTEAAQKKLWNARVITPAGYGDAINVGVLLGDREVVVAVVGLRTHPWPAETGARASAIQGEFERILAMAVARGLKPRPSAKLQRLMGALLPGELTCVLNYEANRHAAELLLGNTTEPGLSGQVKMRARLRDVLGPEKDLSEHVRRSTFCWWLHEHHGQLSIGQMPPWRSDGGGGDRTSSGNDLGPVAEGAAGSPLTIWPFAKQFKGNPTVQGFVDTYRAVVQAALPGITRDDLVAELKSSGGFDKISPQSLRTHLIRIKGLGFLDERDGFLHASKDGDRLLGDDLPDILVERLIERVYGMAQLLRRIEQHPHGSSEEIAAVLQGAYPNWTSTWPVLALLRWSNHLSLIEYNEPGGWNLTAYGALWAKRLPEVLPAPLDAPDVGEDDPVVEAGPVTTAVPAPYPSFPDILAKFQTDPEIASFVFDPSQLATLHAAWRSNPKKRFVLLSGLSGTGKTAVTLCYTRAVCDLMGLPVDKHREIVPVSPDWRDPSGLLGYFNALHADPTFQAEPALRLVLRAAADPGKPYFIILDEMNLARVERYFAPFLSAMETGKELVLHANAAAVNDVPPRIPWPKNLHIAGTVNMDETTHPFSDKVLDRAFTLEFWDVDLKKFFERAAAAEPGVPRLPDAEATLLELHDALRPIRRHFGYRTAGEVLAFLRAAPQVNGVSATTFLDRAVFSKVLPRLRGEDTPAFSGALSKLGELCKNRGLDASAEKIAAMAALLKSTGVTRFWA